MSTTTATSVTITGSAAVSVFNRGPVTVVFTPPASCTSILTAGGSSLYFGHDGGNYYDSACFPPGSAIATSKIDPWGLYWYSPAQCPPGWPSVPVTTWTYTDATTLLYLDSANTIALCCPPGYTSVLSGNHQCVTSVFGVAPTTFLVKKPTSIGNNQWQSTDSTALSPTVLGGTAGGTVTIFGDGIVAMWQSTDITAFTSSPATTSSTSPSTPQTSTNTSSTTSAAPSAAPTTAPPGLSTGAKIGIGVGIPAFALILAIVAFFFYRRRALWAKKEPDFVQYPDIPMYRPETQHQKQVVTASNGQLYPGNLTDNPSYPQAYQGVPAQGEETTSSLQRYSEVPSPTFRTHNPMNNPGRHELSNQ
ncbi:uncharacterized protein PAC_19836 [Phialocephala subalpina]|uniref:Uncharacterized protein n=1 Tax=Phialocephala subalpina TaxID=576137 RepID=A0A1L7XYC4_9HELO|nr:uncharacterized protein PAC_19836 [Phialocephala subalpina]